MFLAGLVGPEFEEQQPTIKGAVARWSLPRFGLRLHGELWSHPTDDTLLAATLVAGTARSHLWGRTAFGYRVWNNVFVGPEASVSMTETYREWRLGAHITGLQLGRFTFGFSGGWRREEDSRHRGLYLNLSGYIRL